MFIMMSLQNKMHLKMKMYCLEGYNTTQYFITELTGLRIKYHPHNKALVGFL